MRPLLSSVRRPPSPCPRPPPRGLRVAGLLLLACGCRPAQAAGEPWVRLARLYEPRPIDTEAPAWTVGPRSGPAPRLRHGRDESSVWIDTAVAPRDWSAGGVPGLWTAPASFPVPRARLDGRPHLAFHADGRALTYRPAAAGPPREPRPGLFSLHEGTLYAYTGEPEPPREATLSLFADAGERRGAAWHLRTGRFSFEGFPLWRADGVNLRVDVPRGSALTFATVARGATGGSGAEQDEVTFRVSLDGVPLLEHAQLLAPGGTVRRHRVELPREGAADASLHFEVEGPPSITAIAEPVLGPASPGPEIHAARRSVVLLLADTFRADNMATYGGSLDLTPNLDALAEESLVCTRAWSSSSWTLPAQASMFSGLFPGQHGAVDARSPLPEEVTTVAEVLRARGYRTAAITDGLFASADYGLDQGFEWFDEHWGGIEHTRDRLREVLEADDGRPLFLFVQSYATHVPYTAGEDVRARRPDLLEGVRDWPGIRASLAGIAADHQPGEPFPEAARPPIEEAERLYRGSAARFDLWLPRLLDELDAHPALAGGALVFTSDHGESFAEHSDEMTHGTSVFEEQIRIPLLVRAPWIEPGRLETAVGLVDLPRTIAELADCPTAAGWRGRSILSVVEERPVFSFQCARVGTGRIAMIDADRKVIVSADPERVADGAIELAFDLGADPAERRDAAGAPWALELSEALLPRMLILREPVHEVDEEIRLGEAKAARLRAAGYVGR